MEASLSKVTQSNSGSKQGKSVVVLLSSDVKESDGMVYLPNFPGQKALRKKEKGQFNNNVLFTWKMTEEDVRREIISHFPYLKDQSFWCASAVDNRKRLEFHGSQRIWNGMCIKRRIKGNSTLYIQTQMTADDLSKALQEPTDEQASHSVGEVSPVASEYLTSLPSHSNQKSVHNKRKNDQDAQLRLPMVQPVVSPSVKRKKGNDFTDGWEINQTMLQTPLREVTTAAPAPVQPQHFPATQTSVPRTVSPSLEPSQMLLPEQQNQPPEGSVQGKHELVIPQIDAIAGISQGVLVKRAGRVPLEMPSRESSVQWQQNQPPEGPAQGQHEIVVPQDMPSPATAGSSQGVLVQRAGRVPLKMPPGESSVQWQTDSGFDSSIDDLSTNYRVHESYESHEHLRAEMTPDWAYTKEERKFTISFSNPLPSDVASYVANFDGKEVAVLTLKNPYTLVGFNPISQTEGGVNISILKVNENEGCVSFAEDLKFTYKNKVKELVKEVLGSEKNRNAAVEGLCSGLQSASTGSDDLNAFRLPEAAPGHI